MKKQTENVKKQERTAIIYLSKKRNDKYGEFPRYWYNASADLQEQRRIHHYYRGINYMRRYGIPAYVAALADITAKGMRGARISKYNIVNSGEDPILGSCERLSESEVGIFVRRLEAKIRGSR